MNANINADLLKINIGTSITQSLFILILYLIGFVCLILYAIKKSKAIQNESFENVWFMRKFVTSYKNNAKTQDARNINVNPLQAGFLLDKKIGKNHIIATILHFLDLGIIKLEKILRNDGTFAYRFEKAEMEFCDYNLYTDENVTTEKKANVIKRGISISEICLIDRIVFKYYNYINADRIFTLYDSNDDFSELYNLKNRINEKNELKLDKEKVANHIKREFIDVGLYSYKENKDNTKTIIESKLYTEKAKLLLEYKDKLKNDTLLSERCIENIYLWGEHLIFGVAFDVCRASIKDAIDIYQDRKNKKGR